MGLLLTSGTQIKYWRLDFKLNFYWIFYFGKLLNGWFIAIIEIDWDSFLNAIFEMGVANSSLTFQDCQIGSSMPMMLHNFVPILWMGDSRYWISNEIINDLNTMSCPIKVNSNSIELTVHTSCFWIDGLTLSPLVKQFHPFHK